MAQQRKAKPQGAMTIDVEEHFHVSAFADVIDRADWPNHTSRVYDNTDRMLSMFAEAGIKGTFFCLGIVAEQHPDLIRKIADQGHEVASHGWEHWRVFEQTEREFITDICRARNLLSEISNQPVHGYRAPSFSIDHRTPWAYAALAKAGHKYSSSSHPIKHDHYGDHNAPRTPWKDTQSGIVEIPVMTVDIAGNRPACGGGGFFRLMPQKWFEHTSKRAIKQGLIPNFYLHPWEIDPHQPRVKNLDAKTRFRHYVGLKSCETKLRKHLRALDWQRMDRVYAGHLI